MNKHCFRLIFSKPLGFLIPVAEIATAQRKPGQQRTTPAVSPASIAPVYSLKRLALSMLVAAVPSWAAAEILLDRSTGATVSTAANGVPVIEIADPIKKPSSLPENVLRVSDAELSTRMMKIDNLKAQAVRQDYLQVRESNSRGNREVFDQWVLHAPDVFDTENFANELGENTLLPKVAAGKYYDPLLNALEGKGPYLAAQQYYYLAEYHPLAYNLSAFAASKGEKQSSVAKWITTAREWKSGLPEAHEKIAKQLADRRPDLLPGFKFASKTPNIGPVDQRDPVSRRNFRKAFDEVLAQAPDVFDYGKVEQRTIQADYRLKSTFPNMFKPVKDALTGTGAYLEALRYHNLLLDGHGSDSVSQYCRDKCVPLASMTKWISGTGQWKRGTNAGHGNVMTQLAARRPDLLTLSDGFLRSLDMAGNSDPHVGVGLDSSHNKVGAAAQQGAGPLRAETAPLPSQTRSPGTLLDANPVRTDKPFAINDSPAGGYVDLHAPPIISLDPVSDDSNNMIIDSAVPSIAASPVNSPEIIEIDPSQDYFRPWIKPEPATSPGPTPEDNSTPLVADAPIKEEVPILRHRIDNAVPILQGENGEDILLAALQPLQKNKQSSSLQELLDRMKLTFGADTKNVIAEQAKLAGEGNIRVSKKRIKDDIGEKARWLAALSGEERSRYMESWMEIEDVPGMGRGVKAARDIPQFTVLAPYAGKLLTGDAINAEWAKLGMNFTSYTFGTKNENSLISAFGDGVGNMSSLVNKGDDAAQNNLTVMLLGSKLVYLLAERPISAGEPLLYDYGEAYDYRGWPKHPILVEESEPSDESGTESGVE